MFKRPSNMNIVDFVNKLKGFTTKHKKYDMELPAGVSAYKLRTEYSYFSG